MMNPFEQLKIGMGIMAILGLICVYTEHKGATMKKLNELPISDGWKDTLGAFIDDTFFTVREMEAMGWVIGLDGVILKNFLKNPQFNVSIEGFVKDKK